MTKILLKVSYQPAQVVKKNNTFTLWKYGKATFVEQRGQTSRKPRLKRLQH